MSSPASASPRPVSPVSASSSPTRSERNNNFLDALDTGKIYEQLYANILQKKYEDEDFKMEFAPNKLFPDWDIKTATIEITGVSYDDAGEPHIDTAVNVITYEVKGDIIAQKYGNIAVEIGTAYTGIYDHLQNKKSGLTATKADMWIHFIHETKGKNYTEYIEVPTATMKQWVKSTDEGGLSHNHLMGGNGGRSEIKLIAIKNIPAEYKKRINHDEIDDELLRKIQLITPVKVNK